MHFTSSFPFCRELLLSGTLLRKLIIEHGAHYVTLAHNLPSACLIHEDGLVKLG